MRFRRLLACLLAGAGLIAACGDDTAADDPSGDGTADPVEDDAAFPVTIEHTYGSTTIESEPQRVVSVSLTDGDAIVALGVMPVAVRAWIPQFADDAFGPWADEALAELDGEMPDVIPSTDLNIEQIATYDPDLILSVKGALTEPEYDLLSQIAPTVAQSADYADFGTPYDAQVRTIGQALGRTEEAEALVAGVEETFAEAREEFPQLDGATGLVALNYGDGELYAYGEQDQRGQFLRSLGLTVPDEVTELAGDRFFATVSEERIDLFDQDVLLWILQGDPSLQAEIEDDPLYAQLGVSQAGADLFLDVDPLGGALGYGTVLAVPFAVDELASDIAAAVDASAGGS